MSEGAGRAPLIERLQQQVADRQPVDWDAVAAEIDLDAASPEQRQALGLLRLLDEIAQIHTSLQSGELDETSSVSDAPSVEDSAETLQAWGRYRLDERVGRGGFGHVFRAWDSSLQMTVAIKILHRRADHESLKDRLLHEGRVLGQIRDPNVVQVLNVEEHDGRLGLVMEFLSGDTLDQIVAAQGRLNEREASVIIEDVCRALVAVHAKGLIHRDVKARNIIRERAGRIVLMDFGAGLSTTADPAENRGVGTPLYMAPETLAGSPATVESDVYSVGVLLFYMVTGRYPYEGGTIDDIRAAQRAGRVQSLLGLRPGLPSAFVRIVDKCLAVDPRDRYPTPAAVLQAILYTREEVVRAQWKRRLYRIGLGSVLLVVLLTFGGFFTSAAYNYALGRGPYVNETAGDWFRMGSRSLLLPIVLLLLTVGIIGAVAAFRRVLVTASSGARGLDRRVSNGCGAIGRRLGMTDPVVCGCWLVGVTSILLGVIWMYWAPLLQAVTSYISIAPAQTLAVLSPSQVEYRANYRVALSLLAVANVAGAFALFRVPSTRARLPQWLVAMELSILVLLLGSMQLPYRMLHDSKDRPVVKWRSQECFVIGERGDDVLLFCPKSSPRNQRASRSRDGIEPTGKIDNLFSAFGR